MDIKELKKQPEGANYIMGAVIQEYRKWRELCALLAQSGAVAKTDIYSKTTARDTPGQRLIACIREWGELRARISK